MHTTILTYADIVTPFGDREETLRGLLGGETRVVAGERYGCPCSYASVAEGFSLDPIQLTASFKQKHDFSHYNNASTLFIYAIAKGDLRAIEEPVSQGLSPNPAVQAQEIAELLGLSNTRILSIHNACAAGATAIDTARSYLSERLYTQAIIMGFERISAFTLTGFSSLSALSSIGARPFDAARDGMSLGEGAAIALLTYDEPRPGDIIIAGSATTNDANHRTGPSRTGDGLAQAMLNALEDAQLKPQDITAIKCHGTATPYNDAMEAKAMATVFGATPPPAVSFKGAIGHLSGAGSLIETIMFTDCLKEKVLPPTCGFTATECEEPLTISANKQSIGTTGIALSAGFGGLNAALILQEVC